MFPILRRNYKKILFIIIFIYFLYPIFKKKSILHTDDDEEISLEFNVNVNDDDGMENLNFPEHKTVKKEFKHDKYMEEYQKHIHSEFLDSHHDQNVNEYQNQEKIIYTNQELAEFNGEKGSKGLYIAILGSIYDVSKGERHYGIDGSYHFFAGRDASTSFITGEFEKVTPDLDDVLKLAPREILSLKQWKEFYDKDYVYKGKLIGRFYNENGDETEYFNEVQRRIQVAIDEKNNQDKINEDFPPCNIEWKAETGTRVWCTSRSGGKERDWIGVPRKYFHAGDSTYRCACVKDNQLDSPNIKEYDDCDKKSTSCTYKIDK